MVARARRPLAERFWALVAKGDGCWEWQGARNPVSGYGSFGIDRETMRYAHRVAWELSNGPIPEGMSVLHRCDNRPCVRPDHLFLGTHTDNMRDMHAKGRASTERPGARGEGNVNAKLTPELVREIRAAQGTARDIGARYGVSDVLVGQIRRRKVWAWLD